MADASFKDVPELFETDLGESLTARTESLSTFRELGPPDLCHVVKSTGRSGQRDLGSYHYVSGVDASSSASLAAYINSLTYAIEDDSGWFTKGSSWKVRNGCYCCFNAFSRVDVRVDVKIPGGVNAYVVDLRGERHEATQEIWQETFLLIANRPITNPEGELRFLQAAEALFLKGWQVGSDPEIQVATVVSNHLTNAILNERPEVSSLLAKSYLGMNEEVKAVQIMSAAMKQTPQSYTLLHVQCDFLRSKGNNEWALKLARQAVNCAPSEFVTWEKLTEIYIDLGQYESALLTLNSCPMFTYNGRDAHRNLNPTRVHLPAKGTIFDILPERSKTEDDEADPALLRLPAPGLRGTWARAYALLTRLVSQIGWDELLKTRSCVFVMEEEYRMQKAQNDIHSHSSSTADTSTNVAAQPATPQRGASLPGASKKDGDADDDASTRGMASPARSNADDAGIVEDADDAGEVGGDSDSDTLAIANGIPTIRISTESDNDKEEGAEEQANGQGEDLRVWTIFRAEVAHFKTQHVAYRKTGLEWEILGDLGLRLHHKEEAKEAYQRCLDAPRYSYKPWSKLLDVYAEEGDIQRTLQVAIRVAAYQYGEYTEMTYPTQIAKCFFKLGQIHGHAKISYTLLSTNLPDQVMKIMENYLHYGAVFKVEGYDF
ncbi:Uncharacterized protein C31F10.16 [Grifola frondosa]|uniref:Uncharacterized protein C31F10.16 n=1 Tax=Grifola frondosa TaxID=5627 RepID=A0A1C7MMW1_GRIFR|nr:Uncharacterized protein C31F10.16 [Grifola frondosa]